MNKFLKFVKEGNPPVFLALQADRLFLVLKGLSQNGLSLLSMAIKKNQLFVVSTLLEKKTDINKQDQVIHFKHGAMSIGVVLI